MKDTIQTTLTNLYISCLPMEKSDFPAMWNTLICVSFMNVKMETKNQRDQCNYGEMREIDALSSKDLCRSQII